MYKVLIAAQVIGWSTISLLMGGCSSKSDSELTTQTLSSNAESASASVSKVTQSVSPAPAQKPSNPQTVSISTTSQNPVPVPYINPLHSIANAAKIQISDTSDSSIKDVSTQPKLNLQLVNKSTEKRATNTDSLADSCHTFPCLILSQDPNNSLNRFNNPIYKLTAYRNKTSNYVFQLDAVTGRAFTQSRNRYQSNTEAPLPDGSYAVVARVVAGTIPEVGGSMVPIFPKRGFDRQMRRTDLGIHWDPSFNKDKKEDGTSGCIGLTNKNDYYRVRDFVLKYRPRYLEVNITQ